MTRRCSLHHRTASRQALRANGYIHRSIKSAAETHCVVCLQLRWACSRKCGRFSPRGPGGWRGISPAGMRARWLRNAAQHCPWCHLHNTSRLYVFIETTFPRLDDLDRHFRTRSETELVYSVRQSKGVQTFALSCRNQNVRSHITPVL